nr:MAG TPA: hypothetical protein [Caudoviricetes sp.]
MHFAYASARVRLRNTCMVITSFSFICLYNI